MTTATIKSKPAAQSAARLDIPEQPRLSRIAIAALDAAGPVFRRDIDKKVVVDPRVTELAFRRRNRPLENGEVPPGEVLRGLYFEHIRLAINRQFARETLLPSIAAIMAAVIASVFAIGLAFSHTAELQSVYASLRGLPQVAVAPGETLGSAILEQQAKDTASSAAHGVLAWLKAKRAEHDARKAAEAPAAH